MNIRSILIAAGLSAALVAPAQARELLNVSYDPTRELYREYNQLFVKHWAQETGEKITIPAALLARFKPGVALRDRLAGLSELPGKSVGNSG